jgi:glycosyltransferase involved in cell wall biosynthesis
MKVLYIGHYKEGSGWSQAAINNIMAMHSADIDLVCRNVKLTDYQATVNPIITQLENKPLKDIDVCIQHVLPHHIVGTKKFKKNIAYFVSESSTIKHMPWISHLKLLDELWVPNNSIKSNLQNDGLKQPIKIIPHTTNIHRYNKRVYERLNIEHNDHKFKFYYIGDLNDRKNIESVIRCFHSEFKPTEPVALVLKVKKHGLDPNALRNYVADICTTIKKELRMYPDVSQYHKELIISEDVDDDLIDSIHYSCDCFVSASHGEGWSIPAFDAMCFSKTPICSGEGGPAEFIDRKDYNTGTLINGVYSVCNHADPAFPELFTGREEWFVPSEKDIKLAMRFYYENKDTIIRERGLLHAHNFSHESIGNLIKDTLNDK